MRDISREQLLAELLALKPAFEREGVTGMAIFGSRARRDNRPDSDVDLVIKVENAGKFSLLDLIGVGHIVEDNVGLESSVILLDKYVDPGFVSNINRNLVQVF